MKKTVIALAIAAFAAAGTASAATVYEQDGTKVELSGSMRIFLGKIGHTFGNANFGQSQRGDLINDGSRIKINASQDLGNGLSAFAGYELRFQNEAGRPADRENTNTFGDPNTRKLFVGFGFENVGKLSFGRQATTADDVVSDQLYFRSGSLNPLTTRSDKSVKFRSDEFAGFSFGADYLFGNAEKYANNGLDYKNGYQAGLFYNLEFAKDHAIDFALTYTTNQYDNNVAGTGTTDTVRKDRAWAFATHYKLDGLYVGAAYGQTRDKTDGQPAVKGHYNFLEAKYDLNDLTGVPAGFGLQWERYSTKENSDAASRIQNQYIAVVDYKFNKHVVPYIQYTRATDKYEADRLNENIYGAGLRVFF
ncbi:porin [Aggregatibacter actinomycetemcomitans]|nr:porin [Aggregatibacter actinomycetemcomitans]